ncbi:hypothetical protein KIK84_03020 [Curvibacter sp. CHRR-16]|uniref:pilus assembly protein n=1 Tax=Curvibacter sp. CHRR-16 TaxID=2835872 RepID=UPI001BD93E38|nr:hypothetical protein [Curvibacter sp. CHRR-16]MBT0569283.1 hypothetical protein [Curvibacter sp. CHRR-16]
MRTIKTHSWRKQQGISLLIVLILLLLTIAAVTGAFRVANISEAFTGSNSDYQRTYAAAEALMQDAEIDVRGRLPPYTTVQADGLVGTPCKPSTADPLLTQSGFFGCRRADSTVPWFPRSSEDFDVIADIVNGTGSARSCLQGICIPTSPTFYSPAIENDLSTMLAVGAYYGQYTGTSPGSVTSNPVLTSNTSAPYARYWVEVLPYTTAPANSTTSMNPLAEDLRPDKTLPYVYRITVVAQGLKAGSRVVLKSVFVPSPLSQNK